MSEMDALALPAVIFVFFLSVAIAWYVVNSFIEGWPVAEVGPVPEGMILAAQNTFAALNIGVLILAIGWLIVGMVLAYFSKAHPVFFVVYLAVAFISLWIAPVMVNMAHDVMAVDGMYNFQENFPMIVLVLNYLPIISFVSVALIGIAQYTGTFNVPTGGSEVW